jgi:hypothetical protein
MIYSICLQVYMTKLQMCKSVSYLMQRITTAVASTYEDMFRWVWKEVDYRTDICRVTKGLYTEHL